MIIADEESIGRLSAMLSTALGQHVSAHLTDPEVIEVMANPDGTLWVDRIGRGREFTGEVLSADSVERAIFIIATSIGSTCSTQSPLLSAELAAFGARFQGVLPPVSLRPCFSVRKKASRIFSIEDYVTQGAVSPTLATNMKQAVLNRKNIVIAGGTGSGKTTLANALLALIAETGDRLVLIEDTLELQCRAKDFISLRARDGSVTMRDLVRATMRLRPDRIVIGEVRGAEALDLLKAWNTGHPGGVATIHADSARKVLSRFEQLVREAGVADARQLIADAVNLIVFIEKTKSGRKVTDMIEVSCSDDGRYSIVPIPGV